MKYFFGNISVVIQYIFRLLVYQVIILYDNIVNKTFILSIFL